MPDKKKIKFSKKQIQSLLDGVYADKVNTRKLPKDLYFATAEYLKEGLYGGFGKTIEAAEISKIDLELLTELRENIYMFSAAKTYQQIREMTDAITNDEGTKRSFNDFKESADKIFDTYNENYLRAEYNTAFASGQMGSLWNDIEENKELFPYLKISVVEDANTSDICEPLDGITLPVDDPFWDEYYPPNHFNCRSTVEQLEEADAKQSSDDQVGRATEHADEHMQDEFKMNVGKDGYIFKDDHPYFEVEKGDREFARTNFGLNIPKDDD